MGIREAKKYITDLRQRQNNPYLWPDFVTGLPDTNAIVKKTDEVYSKLGKYTISVIRIANIHPYLIKYGSEKHSEIIQWAAAILKTTMDEYRGFVGALGSYDFVAVCKAKDTEPFLTEVSSAFEKKMKTFYSKKDLEKKTVLSFKKNGELVNIGLMRLIACTASEKTKVPQEQLIPQLAKNCSEIELQ